ncbi:PREDICTED: uncharacterized protein LOC109206958 [Nicotiana attenuata]|uniref:uncharacterized protein LOC109206958 n=1 Tax=Nicotiana attenuata TaxID=49451 RepID=UPI000904AB6F|nr:PREDICTED: uncharacterized protein LOC109206958 [Nicotiana attenuata]
MGRSLQQETRELKATIGRKEDKEIDVAFPVGPIPQTEGFDLSSEELTYQNVKITIDDIKDKVGYWKSAVICYVLGSNPPLVVMDGYFKRIWGYRGIDKATVVNKGVFHVRFQSEEARNRTVEEGVQMFDKKPIGIKPWKQDIDMKKETIDRIPIWIRLIGLDIKYWGKSALTKIAVMVGKPLKADSATSQKERLTFARILVEVSINQQYPSTIMFENEYGKIIEQRVMYEWKPVNCPTCNKFGHDQSDYRKNTKKEEEREKQRQIQNDQHNDGKGEQERPKDNTGKVGNEEGRAKEV